MNFYPVNLDIADKYCIVVGGGRVAYRKICSLLGCGALVTVISPQVLPEIELLAERNEVLLIRRAYREGDLENGVLVFAATDNPGVQAMVAREARQRHILLNSADDPGRCDFQVPAKVRRGELLITISTGGGSPAISRMIRMELEEQFGPEYSVLIFLFSAIRDDLVPGSTNSEQNKIIFRELLLSNILDAVKASRWESVKAILDEFLPKGLDTGALVDKTQQFATGGVSSDRSH